MRRVHLGDLLAGGRFLAANPQHPAARLLEETHAAHRYFRRFGRPHPRWGDGSLMARCLGPGQAAALSPPV